MFRIIAALTLITISAANAAEPARYLQETPGKVLFIGNSYTYTPSGFGVFAQLPQIAAAAADPDMIVCNSSVIGGGQVWEHWERGDAPAKIRANGYDVVVLQVFRPMLPFSQPDTLRDSVFKYVELFSDLIDSVGAQLVFFMNWEKGGFPYENLTEVSDSFGVHFDAPVVGCGHVWHMILDERPQVNTYSPDNHHPSLAGTYLNSCIFYSAFTRKSPVGNAYRPDISLVNDEHTAYLQGAAWDYMRNYIEPACTDTSAPSAPADVAAAPVSTSELRVTWSAADHAACGVRKYRVFRDGSFIGTSYDPYFTDGHLLGGHDYTYTVSAISLGNIESVPSAAGSGTTLEDTVPPELVEARYTRRATRVDLYFNEMLDTASAEVAGNYAVDNGITVEAASLNGDVVSLTLSPLSADIIYTVTVTGVRDNATGKNVIAAGAEKSFTYVPLSMMDNIIGYWPFDKTLDDFSENEMHGTWRTYEAFTPGYSKDCVEMIGDTSSTHVKIPRAAVQGGMDNLTVSVWVQKAHPDTGGHVFFKHTVYAISLGDDDVNSTVSTDSGGGVNCNAITADINNTEWHHITVTYDGSMIRLYLDAVALKAVAQTGAVRDASRDILVGKYPWGSKRAFKGKIDELRMYDVALDSAGVAALFNDDPYAAGDADSAAVRVLLDRNAIARTVAAVTVRDVASGRVKVLNLDSLGLDLLTDHIGQLTAMRSLYCIGDEAGTDTALVYVDPAIGNCTALETLIIRDNTLTSLPDGITNLTGLTLLDVGNNMLCDISDPVKTWLDTYDPDWAATQAGCTGIIVPVAVSGPDNGFTIRQQDGLVVIGYRGRARDAGVKILATDGSTMFSRQLAGRSVSWHGAASGVFVVRLRVDGVTETVKILVR